MWWATPMESGVGPAFATLSQTRADTSLPGSQSASIDGLVMERRTSESGAVAHLVPGGTVGNSCSFWTGGGFEHRATHSPVT